MLLDHLHFSFMTSGGKKKICCKNTWPFHPLSTCGAGTVPDGRRQSSDERASKNTSNSRASSNAEGPGSEAPMCTYVPGPDHRCLQLKLHLSLSACTCAVKFGLSIYYNFACVFNSFSWGNGELNCCLSLSTYYSFFFFIFQTTSLFSSDPVSSALCPNIHH